MNVLYWTSCLFCLGLVIFGCYKIWNCEKKNVVSFSMYKKTVESPRKYVQSLSEMLLLGNPNTNRRFQKPFLWPKSQGRLQIVQYVIWEGHGCLREIFFLFITVSESSNGNWPPTFSKVVSWELRSKTPKRPPPVTRLRANIKWRSTVCMCISCCCQGGK